MSISAACYMTLDESLNLFDISIRGLQRLWEIVQPHLIGPSEGYLASVHPDFIRCVPQAYSKATQWKTQGATLSSRFLWYSGHQQVLRLWRRSSNHSLVTSVAKDAPEYRAQQHGSSFRRKSVSGGGVGGVCYMARSIMEILFAHPDYYYSHINRDGNIDGSFIFIYSFINFETGSSIAQVILQFIGGQRMTLSLWPCCLHLPSIGITGVCYHAQHGDSFTKLI